MGQSSNFTAPDYHGERQPLRKEIRQQRAGGDVARLELDFHGVEAVSHILDLEQFQIAAGGETEGILLALIDGFRRTDETDLGAGFDFDKDENIPVAADQVDLAAGGFVIAGQHLVTVAAHKSARHALTVGADFRRACQFRRGRPFVSVQMFADELGKGREG